MENVWANNLKEFNETALSICGTQKEQEIDTDSVETFLYHVIEACQLLTYLK